MKLSSFSRGFLYFILAIFFVLTIHIWYRYLLFVSDDVDVKSWTFVEGLSENDQISYLPYVDFSSQTRFYQGLLFDSCLDFYTNEALSVEFVSGMCDVVSDDNQTFFVTLNTTKLWSNQEVVTLDDIYVTYNDLLVNNIWDIPSLDVYKDVAVSYDDGVLQVTFPDSSLDNRIFFTHFVLPAYSIVGERDDYLATYQQTPIWSGCASVRPQGIDETSLIFDVSACPETKFENYQVKYFWEDLNVDEIDYVDIFNGLEIENDSFESLDIPTRAYPVLYFNTTSEKLSPKINRALGGYIVSHFYQDDWYQDYLLREHLLFNQFLSVGDNVGEFIVAKNPQLPVDKYDLQKINIEEIPQELSLAKNDSQVYFSEWFSGYKTLRLLVDDSYDTITIQHNDSIPYAPRTYDSLTQSFFYTLADYNLNLVEGLNEYVIVGTIDGEEVMTATIDLYYLSAPLDDDQEIDDADKLNVLYYDSEISNLIIARLNEILVEWWLDHYFTFQKYSDISSFEGKLLSEDYDLVLRTVDLGERNDLSSLFSSQIPTRNPSLYNNAIFSTALRQYANGEATDDVIETIVNMYGQDLPFVILGSLSSSLSIHTELVDVLDGYTLSDYDLHQVLYQRVALGTKKVFTWESIYNRDNIMSFFDQWGELLEEEVVLEGE